MFNTGTQKVNYFLVLKCIKPIWAYIYAYKLHLMYLGLSCNRGGGLFGVLHVSCPCSCSDFNNTVVVEMKEVVLVVLRV